MFRVNFKKIFKNVKTFFYVWLIYSKEVFIFCKLDIFLTEKKINDGWSVYNNYYFSRNNKKIIKCLSKIIFSGKAL